MVICPVPPIIPPPILELRAVARRWRPGILGVAPEVDALHDISLRIGPGELVVLTGPAGAGKSSLLMLASGKVAPSAGTIRWNGEPVPSGVRPQRIGARPVAYGFLTVRQAIAFHADQLALQDARLRPPIRFLPLLRRVGLHGRSRVRVGDLSALDAFRVVIAQALLAHPGLLCCDEPFALCGPAEREQAIRLVRRVTASGIAVLVATRDAEGLAPRHGLERLLSLQAGRFGPSGPPLNANRSGGSPRSDRTSSFRENGPVPPLQYAVAHRRTLRSGRR